MQQNKNMYICTCTACTAQGFITVTTFTNWQRNFRFDSLHKSAFSCDPPSVEAQMLDGTRKKVRSVVVVVVVVCCMWCDVVWCGVVWCGVVSSEEERTANKYRMNTE